MAHNYKNGLTQEEVEESRKKYGDNVLTPPKKDPLWKQFLEKFSDRDSRCFWSLWASSWR